MTEIIWESGKISKEIKTSRVNIVNLENMVLQGRIRTPMASVIMTVQWYRKTRRQGWYSAITISL